MKELNLKAPAKINLALQIKEKRADNFHELQMIMQSISLADKIKLKKRSEGILLKTSDINLPTNEANLAYQAAEIFFKENNLNAGVEIYIEKNIPVAAGLAGGSTDAAAVMRGLYELYEIKKENLMIRKDLEKIGSDVPYCFKGGTAYAYGRGEKIKQLPFIGEKFIVLVTPNFNLSTPKAYRLYDQLDIKNTFDFKSLIENIKSAAEIDWSLDYKNDFSLVTEKLCPAVKDIKTILNKTRAEITMVSGSGPTVFSVYENKDKAEQAAANWPRENDFVKVVHTIAGY